MDDFGLYVLFNNISVITAQWVDGNERFCAMEPLLRFKSFALQRDSNPGLLYQQGSAVATELLGLLENLKVEVTL